MVCITGQVARHLLGTDAFQETDVLGISMPVTKWNYQVTDINELPEVLAKAFFIAKNGRPGPVLIDITKDVQIAKFDFSYKKCERIRSLRPVPEANGAVSTGSGRVDQRRQKALHSGRPRHFDFRRTK